MGQNVYNLVSVQTKQIYLKLRDTMKLEHIYHLKMVMLVKVKENMLFTCAKLHGHQIASQNVLDPVMIYGT